MYCGHAIIYPTTTKYLTFFKMRFCFVSIIIIYGLHVVFCLSIALRAPAFLAPETLLDIHTENCQTVELDESTRCLTNKRCTSIFVVILFFAFFYIEIPGSPYRQSYHTTTRAKVRSTVPAVFVYHTTSHIFLRMLSEQG